MIDYDKGKWSLAFAFTWQGSIFPKAIAWALPNSCAASLIYYAYYHYEEQGEQIWVDPSSVGLMWSSFNFILGFFIVFRTQQAYARYWEGATLLRQKRGEIFNAASSIIAFCVRCKERKDEVDAFQHLLIRLLSLLNCMMFQSVSDLAGETFPIINTEGMCPDSLKFLKDKYDNNQKCEIIMQWIQRLIVEHTENGILTVPAPILTRVFQDLSRGNVYISAARNLTDIPFPFPYAQMLTALLVFHWALTPMLAGLVLRSGVWSFLLTFGTTFAFWGTNYIAAEIESPFGDDLNDLPLKLMQEDFNQSLWLLLERKVQDPPAFSFQRQFHMKWKTSCDDTYNYIATSSRGSQVRGTVSHGAKKRSYFVRVRHSMRTISDICDLSERGYSPESSEIDTMSFGRYESEAGRYDSEKSGSGALEHISEEQTDPMFEEVGSVLQAMEGEHVISISDRAYLKSRASSKVHGSNSNTKDPGITAGEKAYPKSRLVGALPDSSTRTGHSIGSKQRRKFKNSDGETSVGNPWRNLWRDSISSEDYTLGTISETLDPQIYAMRQTIDALHRDLTILGERARDCVLETITKVFVFYSRVDGGSLSIPGEALRPPCKTSQWQPSSPRSPQPITPRRSQGEHT